MRRSLSLFGSTMVTAFVLAFLPGRVVAVGEVPELLNEALTKVAQDQNRWAYTETNIQKDDKGKLKRETVVRVDPSKPYAEQYTLLSFNGKEPTEKQLKEYRRKGEKLGEAAERKERGLPDTSKQRRPSVGEIVDLDHAVVTSEDAKIVTYEVPLLQNNNQRFPPDKFQVVARVNKQLRAIENVSVRLREPVRSKLIVKISSGEATVDFTPVDSKFAPVMSSVQGEAAVSIVFVNVGGQYDLKRTDFKRVKPFGDRFGVQIGPTKALDF